MTPQGALEHLKDKADGLTAALIQSAEWLEKTLARMDEVRAHLGQLLTLDRVPERAFENLVGEVQGHFDTAASAAFRGAEDAEQHVDNALCALDGAARGEYSCQVGEMLFQMLNVKIHTWIAQQVGDSALADSTVDGLVGLISRDGNVAVVRPEILRAFIEHAAKEGT
jgi:hypothetical protein